MPPDAEEVGSPQDWLVHARSNLIRAKQPKPAGVLWEDLCFDAQQAAEKAIKAVLVHRGIDFPKSHQIAELLLLVSGGGQSVPERFWEADALTDYAVTTRYPFRGKRITEDQYRQAVQWSEEIVQWAAGIVHGG